MSIFTQTKQKTITYETKAPKMLKPASNESLQPKMLSGNNDIRRRLTIGSRRGSGRDSFPVCDGSSPSKIRRRMTQAKRKEEMPVALTADGKPFSHTAVYHFFDGQSVRTTEGLRRVDYDNLGSMGIKIVPIAQLYSNRDDALSAAQQFYLSRIESHREQIRKLEAEKSPKARSLKAVLMSRG